MMESVRYNVGYWSPYFLHFTRYILCNMYIFQYAQIATSALCSQCALHHVHFACYNVYSVICTEPARHDGSARQTSWKDQFSIFEAFGDFLNRGLNRFFNLWLRYFLNKDFRNYLDFLLFRNYCDKSITKIIIHNNVFLANDDWLYQRYLELRYERFIQSARCNV